MRTALLFITLSIGACYGQVNIQNSIIKNGVCGLNTSSGGGGGFPSTSITFDWQLNGNLTDASGNSNTATVTAGSLSYTTGQDTIANHAASLNGSTYFTLSDATVANFTSSDFSISFWVNPGTGAISSSPFVIEKGNFNNNGYFAQIFATGTPGSGGIDFYINQSGARQITEVASASIPEGSWTHVVFTRQGTVGKIYINGVDTTSSADSIINPATDTSDGFRVGAAAGGTSTFTGAVDEVAVWSRALTSTEVSTIFSLNAR